MSAVVKLVNESSTNAMYGASLSNRSYALNAPFAMRRAVMKYSSRRRNRDVFIFGLVVESRKKKSAYVITLHSRSGKTRREILFSLTLVTLFYAISFQLEFIYFSNLFWKCVREKNIISNIFHGLERNILITEFELKLLKIMNCQ